jgi:hypothetical protein
MKHTKMNKIKRLLCSSVMVCGVTSCTNSTHLLLYQHSNLGMNTGVNPANQNVHVRIGARSQFAAVVPKYVDTFKGQDGTALTTADGEPQFEAASAYFGSRFRVTSIWQIPEAAQVLVTGQAAVIAASNGRLKLRENYDTPESKPTEAQADTSQVAPSVEALGDAAEVSENVVTF